MVGGVLTPAADTVKVPVAEPPPGAALATITVRGPKTAAPSMLILAVSKFGPVTFTEVTTMPAPKSTVVVFGRKPLPLILTLSVAPGDALGGSTDMTEGFGLRTS